MREYEKAQFAQYVEQVTGTVPIRSATDCAEHSPEPCCEIGKPDVIGAPDEPCCKDA